MKKKLLSITLALILCLSLAVPAFAANGSNSGYISEELTAQLAADDGDRGVITYTEAIAPQYEDVGHFGEGLAPVKKNGKWGFIDKEGKVVIPFQYDYAWGFNEGYSIVGTIVDQADEFGNYSLKLGFIDKSNNYKDFVDPCGVEMHRDTALIQAYNQDYTPEDEAFIFHNGVVGLWNVYSSHSIYHTDGVGILVGWGDAWILGPMNEGLIPVQFLDGVGYVDSQGNTVKFIDEADQGIVSLGTFNQGIARATVYRNSGYLTGFIDRNYNWIIEPQYTRFWYQNIHTTQQFFGDTGLAMLQNASGMYGAINKSGKTVIPFKYENLMPVENGMIAFQSGGKWGYMNASDYKVKIPNQYEEVTGFNSMGLAVVYDGSKAYLIDKDGNAVSGSDKIDLSSYFSTDEDGNVEVYTPGEYVIIGENGKYGFGHISYLPKLPDRSEMSSWAYESVVAAIEENLVPTYLQNLYPNSIKREEFCDLIVQSVEEILDTDIETLVQQRTGKSLDSFRKAYPFTDSTSSNVIAANALGIISGRGNGVFDPYATITRQEAASMLMRAAGVLGMDTGKAEDVDFADSGKISSWAADAINYVYKINVMSGIGGNQFGPQGTYSREQSFMTAYRLLLALLGD